MCVPDLRGSQGTFSFYSSTNGTGSDRTGGETCQVQKNGDTITGELIGPENPFRIDRKILKISFTIRIIEESSADMKINGVSYRLKKNTYTEWIKVSFKAAPGIKVSGICKFLLINACPEFELYVTPINIDPEKPALKISHPAVYIPPIFQSASAPMLL